MKILAILLLIYLNFAQPADDATFPRKVYPKKVKPGNIQLINAGKYKKSVHVEKKYPSDAKEYTAFPLGRGDLSGQLGSVAGPYIAEDVGKIKPRVKKVLPDYLWSIRRKRSADSDDKKPVDLVTVNVENSTKVQDVIVANNVTVRRSASAETTINQSTKPKKSTTKKVTTKPKRGSSDAKKGKKKDKKGSKVKGAKNGTKTSKRKRKNNKRTGRGKNTRPSKVLKPARAGKTTKGKGISRRLIAARDALIEDYPYVVSIQKDGTHWCAGAILNPRLVITTANCLWKSSRMSRMEVRAGTRHVDRGGQLAGISEVMKHPSWGIRKDPDNDVALVLLDRNLRFSDSVHAVDLPNRVMMPAFDDAWVTSWGAERRDGIYNPKPLSLQMYHARLLDHVKCNNVTHRFGVTVTDNFICLSQTGRRAPCTRDTGAPAVSDGILWGLASWGIRKLCGTERFPAMFSYLASQENMDFIMNATRYLMSDERHYPFLDRYPFQKPTVPTTTPETFPF